MEPMDLYRIEIFFSPPDKCFIANVPECKYCSASGDTHEEALAEVKVALSLWLETRIESGWPIPAPCHSSSSQRTPESSKGRASSRRKRAMAARKAKARATPAGVNGSRQKNVRR